jgi:hypothetical protein
MVSELSSKTFEGLYWITKEYYTHGVRSSFEERVNKRSSEILPHLPQKGRRGICAFIFKFGPKGYRYKPELSADIEILLQFPG